MPILQSVKNYWELTKPKIWFLLVFTGVAAMLVAYREVNRIPSILELAIGMIAITAGSAAANALTNYHDRDIDSIMVRTRQRPIPSGRIAPDRALIFGLTLALFSVLLALWFNWLAATFMIIGLLDNIVVYSLWLKRRSWLNIILGGVSGGMPVFVGYSAIASSISPLAIFMAALVIVWIPTHIWSLAIRCRDDYKRAQIPMLPVIVGDRVASVCIAFTSSLLAVFSIAIFAFTTVSAFYLVSTLVSGAAILGYSVKLAIDHAEKTAWKLFKISSPYLAFIFTFIVLNVWFV
jgi:protoheme IX farnesyltransferase